MVGPRHHRTVGPRSAHSVGPNEYTYYNTQTRQHTATQGVAGGGAYGFFR